MSLFGKKDELNPDLHLFTVYDTKTESYAPPIVAPNSAVLIRDFTTAFRKANQGEDNNYFMHAEDYQLFQIGSYNFKEGVIHASQPTHVVNLHEIKSSVTLNAGPRALSPT